MSLCVSLCVSVSSRHREWYDTTPSFIEVWCRLKPALSVFPCHSLSLCVCVSVCLCVPRCLCVSLSLSVSLAVSVSRCVCLCLSASLSVVPVPIATCTGQVPASEEVLGQGHSVCSYPVQRVSVSHHSYCSHKMIKGPIQRRRCTSCLRTSEGQAVSSAYIPVAGRLQASDSLSDSDSVSLSLCLCLTLPLFLPLPVSLALSAGQRLGTPGTDGHIKVRPGEMDDAKRFPEAAAAAGTCFQTYGKYPRLTFT